MQQCVKEPDTLRHLVKALRMGRPLHQRADIKLKLTAQRGSGLCDGVSSNALGGTHTGSHEHTLTMQTRATFHMTHIRSYAGLSLAVSFPTLINIHVQNENKTVFLINILYSTFRKKKNHL